MNELGEIFITIGILFLIGLVTDGLGSRTRLPRVTLLIIFGFVVGPSVLNLLPEISEKWFTSVTDITLVMVAFLLGEKLTFASLRQHGRFVLGISIAVVIATSIVTLIGLLLIGVPIIISLLFAGIAPATDPAATSDVVHETRADGQFSRTLLGIVAVDDAWGLIVFSIMLAVVQLLNGEGGSLEVLASGAWDLCGAIIIGIALGIPMAYLTGRIRPGEPTMAEALGMVFLCCGITIWLEVSFLLASMVMGIVVANLARHHERPFHAIEGIEWPFMILFFILSGASFQIESFSQIGFIGLAYIILRIVGRIVGARVGGTISNADPSLRQWMGLALMPQAGVALGMALVAKQRFPDFGEIIIPVVIAATVLFEIIGPVLTRGILVHTGEVRTPRSQRYNSR